MAFIITFTLLFSNVPLILYAMQFGNLELSPEVTLRSEYDDNINLNNNLDEEIQEDFVFYINPLIDLHLPYKDHYFSLNFNSDYRKGIKTGLKDINLDISGDIDLNFARGLSINLMDTYTERSFDQGLYGEPGISDSRSNNYGIVASYTFVERLSLESKYYHKWEKFEEESSPKKRGIDTFGGNLSIPITWSIGAYTSYYYHIEESKEEPYRNHDINSYIIGGLWTGPYRFSIWLEVGYEKIDYNLQTEPDFKNVIGEFGLKIKFTELTKGELSIGKDGYDNTIYSCNLNYLPSADKSLRLNVVKQTKTSFSGTFTSNIYESTSFNIEFTKTFIECITTTIGINFQRQDSFSDIENRRDSIWIGKLSFNYSIQEWLIVGSRYQYSKRDSIYDRDEYKNNRVGLFITVIF